MPELTWYFIGPDKTGFNCTDCCAGFSFSGESCLPYACPTSPSKFRKYLCPNSEFPTPHHMYKWNGNPDSSATIAVNPIVCPNSSTTCWSYTPSGGLNAAGRIGSNCSQSYVTSSNICMTSITPCTPGPCAMVSGNIFYPKSCITTASGCICSSGSSYNTCTATCDDSDPECDPCERCYHTCPSGEIVEYDCGYSYECSCDSASEPTCPGGCSPDCDGNGNWFCPPVSCTPACSSGYSCNCGICSCVEQACCSGISAGWTWNSGLNTCEPCYQGYWSRSDCCYKRYKQKHCSNENDTCCNDGRCYSQSTVLCQIPTGNQPPP